ncbi:serine dehydratase beta chain [Micromonospora sp. NPDC092111]|uniref:serine dehydratase beta chain n=1 Tax=Micromonospora sp. NPDC092111 TaxID=3364289 RepID=UPI003816FB5B
MGPSSSHTVGPMRAARMFVAAWPGPAPLGPAPTRLGPAWLLAWRQYVPGIRYATPA